MNALTVAGIALVSFGLALVLVGHRLAHWARRCAEMERRLAVSAEREQALSQTEVELGILWPCVTVRTARQGAAAATLRALFPSLGVPGVRPTSSCVVCKATDCLFPGRCDNPENAFGGVGR